MFLCPIPQVPLPATEWLNSSHTFSTPGQVLGVIIFFWIVFSHVKHIFYSFHEDMIGEGFIINAFHKDPVIGSLDSIGSGMEEQYPFFWKGL